jgi:hypothetical protein
VSSDQDTKHAAIGLPLALFRRARSGGGWLVGSLVGCAGFFFHHGTKINSHKYCQLRVVERLDQLEKQSGAFI